MSLALRSATFCHGAHATSGAAQSYAGSDIENVGWVIPGAVLGHFLSDFERSGGYTGFPVLGVQWQKLESDVHKKQLQMRVRRCALLRCGRGVGGKGGPLTCSSRSCDSVPGWDRSNSGILRACMLNREWLLFEGEKEREASRLCY